ncbi:MAG: ABC transporter permease [Pseudomonadales bacterium]|jgi:oligopeptide transport system permease protein|nr:ABC transporter permease [Pseudomonadales bacterium]
MSEQTSTSWQPSASDFASKPKHQTAEAITRPAMSYWQDAWRRLKENKRALFSLYLIIGLVTFTLAGPYLWTIDPSAQDLDQIGMAPGADRNVTIAPAYQPWYGPTDDQAYANDNALGLTLVGNATSQAVRLAWRGNDYDQANYGYKIYRTLFPLDAGDAFGLPLMESKNHYFEDRLDLQPTDYYYTVVALDSQGVETDQFATLKLTVKRVITVLEAQKRGLTKNGPVTEGEQIKLALHPFGTDYLGRDMLARLIYGGQVSLFIGIFAPLLYVLLGVIYGSIAGFMGGAVDQLMMRFADFAVALPFLLFMILLKVIFGIGPGESGVLPMLVAMVILLWPAPARLVRGQILQIREEGYVSASQLLGAKTNYLVFRHMVPNTMGVILVTITFQVPSAIFTEAFLSFIGMGVAPPTPSWGSMCNDGIKSMLTRPHELFFPALFISITVLAFNLLGDGLRDALDARMRNRE